MMAKTRIRADREILQAWPYRCKENENIFLVHGRVTVLMDRKKAREHAELEVLI